MAEPIIQVEEIGKCYRVRHADSNVPAYETLRGALQSRVSRILRRSHHVGEPVMEDFWALKEVSFNVSKGEVVGVVGGNGAGKSTLLKILSKITLPSTGQAKIWGRVASLLEVGTGFHPELTGRENIFLNGAILGMSRQHMQGKFDEIVSFAEVAAFLDTPVKRYSSGMQMRLAFAVAAHLEPEVLIVDEVLAVGDAAFQKKCLGRLGELATGDRTILFVSHNLTMLRHLCPRSLFLERGHLVADGPTGEVIGQYLAHSGRELREMRWCMEDAPGDESFRLLSTCLSGGGSDKDGVPNGRCELKLEFQLSREVPDLVVGFELHTDSGEFVLSSYLDDEVDAAPPQLSSGRHQWSCQIPNECLKSGRYLIAIRVASLERKWIVKQDSVLEFEVRNDALDRLVTENPAKRWLRRGAVAPVLEWRRTGLH